MRSLAFFALCFGLVCTASEASILRLGTSTSTANSGLLNHLLPKFTEDSEIEVTYRAVGTGAALKLARDGKLDVLLVHAAEAEQKFMAQGYGSRREFVMFNDFVIVGPRPFGVKNLYGAMKVIPHTFVSRGDHSGTHKKEQMLWLEVGYDPIGEPWYMETGSGMGNSLVIANKLQAYTIIDRGTWLANRDSVSLIIAFENSPFLMNEYSAIVVTSSTENLNTEAANRFVDWLLSSPIQQHIASYKVNDTSLFKPKALYPR